MIVRRHLILENMSHDDAVDSRAAHNPGRFWIPGAVVILAAGLGCGRFFSEGSSPQTVTADKPIIKDKITQTAAKPDAKRAKKYLVEICKLGPRVSGSRGMQAQRRLLADHFAKHRAKVKTQQFDAPHPLTGRPVRFANLIVSWNPKAKQRVLLACHYDTRPFPDRDRRNPKGRFIGANDGASGVALFMEMAHHMKGLKSAYGVDMVFFDGEEYVFSVDSPINRYFVGSKYFSKEYAKRPPKHRYVYGILVDMVADRDLQLYMETNSLKYAPALTMSIWSTAAKIGVREFIGKEKHEIQDDHLPLNRIARIPTCDLIDFDYPHWHTTQDVPAKCSGDSLAKVARVLLTWLENVPQPAAD